MRKYIFVKSVIYVEAWNGAPFPRIFEFFPNICKSAFNIFGLFDFAKYKGMGDWWDYRLIDGCHWQCHLSAVLADGTSLVL